MSILMVFLIMHGKKRHIFFPIVYVHTEKKTVDIFIIEFVIKLPDLLTLQEFYCFTSK